MDMLAPSVSAACGGAGPGWWWLGGPGAGLVPDPSLIAGTGAMRSAGTDGSGNLFSPQASGLSGTGEQMHIFDRPGPVNTESIVKTVKKKVYPISALNKEGLSELIEAIAKKLKCKI